MNTAAIIENMNYLPSFAKEVVKEAKTNNASVRESKYWRHMGTKFAIQPTKGDKPSTTFKGKTKAATKADLNWAKLYFAFIIDGEMKGGFSLDPKMAFDLIKLGHFGTYDPANKIIPAIVTDISDYFEANKVLEAALTADQIALLS